MKVLVVDDSAAQRLILKSVVQNFDKDLDVIDLADGTQALKELKNGGVSLVFSDINMEPMSGIELVNECKALDIDPVFAFVTSHLTDTMKEKADSIGVKYFITKPITQDKIEEVLKEVLHA
ncbi:MAG: hypothetical protein BM556_14915 [Bacteriovorax sp. MedPE-SWde]|nr:MAG: hypothetical protein BM556_14915 [Bacteriovorax sp. MedPE-SWde]